MLAYPSAEWSNIKPCHSRHYHEQSKVICCHNGLSFHFTHGPVLSKHTPDKQKACVNTKEQDMDNKGASISPHKICSGWIKGSKASWNPDRGCKQERELQRSKSVIFFPPTKTKRELHIFFHSLTFKKHRITFGWKTSVTQRKQSMCQQPPPPQEAPPTAAPQQIMIRCTLPPSFVNILLF